jgi:tetratricopeptide (TPR) repeat protein
MLVAAAALAEEHEPEAAVKMLADATEACLYGGAPAGALDAGRRARALAPEDGGADDFLADCALGQALFVNGRADEGAPLLERALRTLAASPSLARRERLLVRAADVAGWLDRPLRGLELAQRAAALAREEGAFGVLHQALSVTGWLNMRCGRWREGCSFSSEALALGRESGETTTVVYTSTTWPRSTPFKATRRAAARMPPRRSSSRAVSP